MCILATGGIIGIATILAAVLVAPKMSSAGSSGTRPG